MNKFHLLLLNATLSFASVRRMLSRFKRTLNKVVPTKRHLYQLLLTDHLVEAEFHEYA